MNRLAEIDSRMQEIRESVDTAAVDDLVKLDTETRELTEERQKIMDEIETREKLKRDIGEGRKGAILFKPAVEVREKRFTTADEEYTTAWAKSLLCLPLSHVEQRALSEANNIEYRDSPMGPITTTSETFVQQTDSVLGQNNGGLFIPKYISDRLLSETTLESPILRDVFKMAVAGLTKYPYKVQGDPAKWREETVCNDLEAIQWSELTFTMKELSKTIRITWKLESMTPDSFVNYIISELRREMEMALAVSMIYGMDNLDISGLQNTNLTYAPQGSDTIVDTLIKAGDVIPKQNRSGAKIYISNALATQISLLKDSNGNYMIPPFSGDQATRIGRYQMEVDPYLEDGDAFIGNLNRGAILNTVEGVSITKDVMGRCRINDYTAFAIYGSVIVPNYIVKITFPGPFSGFSAPMSADTNSRSRKVSE